jgi:hypothetical protein
MSLFHRHASVPPRPRIAITAPDPVDEVRRLRGLIENLRPVEQQWLAAQIDAAQATLGRGGDAPAPGQRHLGFRSRSSIGRA